jgi:hypothetical protein
MRDHTKLRAFELADELAVTMYRAMRDFPKEAVEKEKVLVAPCAIPNSLAA